MTASALGDGMRGPIRACSLLRSNDLILALFISFRDANLNIDEALDYESFSKLGYRLLFS